MKVAIVGAGICGSLLAYELIKKQHHVTVYDKGSQEDTCSYAAAGMLAPVAELESANTDVYDLGLRSLNLWPKILDELSQQGASIFYRSTGTLVVAHHQDLGSFQQFSQGIRAKLPNDHQQAVEFVNVTDLEPELESFNTGLWLKHEAQVDSHQVLSALHANIHNNGDWVSRHVHDIKPHSVDGEVYDWIFDCRGLAAKADVPLYGVRGERLLLHAPEVNLQHMVRLMHPRYRLYIVPREDHHYVVGATEIQSADNGPVSVRSALELLSAAYSLHSGFAEARIISMHSGVRPACLDHQPYIHIVKGLTRINGLYRHGYLLAPAVIEKALTHPDFLFQSQRQTDEYSI